VQAGNWIREHRGIYGLASFPRGERPDLMLWSLWSRNRGEAAQGVYSHQTALILHDLSDVIPAKLHMAVPRSFLRNSEIPRALVLHFADLPESDRRGLIRRGEIAEARKHLADGKQLRTFFQKVAA
jgi:hypothetical protein